MFDPTEATRREMGAQINAPPGSRDAMETHHGQKSNTSQTLFGNSRDPAMASWTAGSENGFSLASAPTIAHNDNNLA